jgi:hypothetical protein
VAKSKYTIHNKTSMKDVIYFKGFGPPSSPPTTFDLLINNINMATRASEQKIVTLNARLKRNSTSCIYLQNTSSNIGEEKLKREWVSVPCTLTETKIGRLVYANGRPGSTVVTITLQ